MVGCGRPSNCGLRRARDHQRVHARGLGGHDVHHHAGRVDGVAAGHVEADPLDGHPAFGHRRAGRQRRWWCRCGAGRRAPRGCARSPPRARCGRRVAARSRARCQLGRGHPDLRGPHAVERLAVLQGGLGAARGDRVDDRAGPSAPPRRRRRHRAAAPTADRAADRSAPRRSMRAMSGGDAFTRPIVPEQAKSISPRQRAPFRGQVRRALTCTVR